MGLTRHRQLVVYTPGGCICYYPCYTSDSDPGNNKLVIHGYGNVLLGGGTDHGLAVNIGGTICYARCEYPQVSIYSCTTSCVTGVFYTCACSYIRVRIDTPMYNNISLAYMGLCIDYGAGACAECASWTAMCENFKTSICFTKTCCAGMGYNKRFVRLRYLNCSGVYTSSFCYEVPFMNCARCTCTSYIRTCSALVCWY